MSLHRSNVCSVHGFWPFTPFPCFVCMPSSVAKRITSTKINMDSCSKAIIYNWYEHSIDSCSKAIIYNWYEHSIDILMLRCHTFRETCTHRAGRGEKKRWSRNVRSYFCTDAGGQRSQPMLHQQLLVIKHWLFAISVISAHTRQTLGQDMHARHEKSQSGKGLSEWCLKSILVRSKIGIIGNGYHTYRFLDNSRFTEEITGLFKELLWLVGGHSPTIHTYIKAISLGSTPIL